MRRLWGREADCTSRRIQGSQLKHSTRAQKALFAGKKLSKHLTQTRSWFQTWQKEFIFAYGRSLLVLRQSDLFDLATISNEIMSFPARLKSDIEQIVKDTLQLEELKIKSCSFCLSVGAVFWDLVHASTH